MQTSLLYDQCDGCAGTVQCAAHNTRTQRCRLAEQVLHKLLTYLNLSRCMQRTQVECVSGASFVAHRFNKIYNMTDIDVDNHSQVLN